MAHLIRFHAYNDRNDFLSVRFMLNGFLNNSRYENNISERLKNKLIGNFKSQIYFFRKKTTWHTNDGIKRISESRKGKIVVKDSITGEFIGEVSVDHPKYLSGEYVHHTRGMVSVIEISTGEKKYIDADEYKKNNNLYRCNNGDPAGVKNSRYSGFTDSELIEFVVNLSKSIGGGFLVSYHVAIDFYKKKYNYNLPKSLRREFRFNGRGFDYELAENISGLKYNPYYMNNPINRDIVKTNLEKLLKE